MQIKTSQFTLLKTLLFPVVFILYLGKKPQIFKAILEDIYMDSYIILICFCQLFPNDRLRIFIFVSCWRTRISSLCENCQVPEI